MQSILSRLFLSIALAALSVVWIHASPSGLNNIPTADTAPDRTVVIQEYSTFGADRKPDHTAGFKMGLQPWGQRFEWGLDGHLAPGDSGPAAFQIKYAIQPWEKLPTLGIGVANLAVTSEDRDRAGQPFSYAVLSHDFNLFRMHGGYGLQAHYNNTVLLGVDKTIKLFNRDFTLRADAIQSERQHNWVGSFGGMYSFCKYFTLEAWINQPIHRAPASFTTKLDFSLHF